MYLFDAKGDLLEARVEEVISRQGDDETIFELEQMVAELGEVVFGRIEIKPFSVKRFDLEFGLVVQRPTPTERTQGEDWLWVSLQPGDAMAFQEPFDSGEYDT